MSYLDCSIEEIHQALVDKKTTVLELTKEAIERAKKDTCNSFEYICEKEALEFAEKINNELPDNLFFGIPYVVKDNYSTKGIPTTGSSDILKDYVPIFNATVIEKLQAAKAVLIGKTTLDELAMGGTGTTGHLGKTFNPYDNKHERLVGGSSCGSASSVAASIIPFSLGSDTGDSIRKPASLAGLVGYKPTWGSISRFGLFPFCPSLDTVGFFTRSVKDSAYIFDLLRGKDVHDLTSFNLPNFSIENFKNNSEKKFKFLVVKEIIESIPDEFYKTKFNELILKLEAEGNEIEIVEFGKDLLESFFPTYFVISCAEATSNNANLDGLKFGNLQWEDDFNQMVKKTRTEGFGHLIKKRFIIGSYCLLKENQEELYLNAKRNRNKIVNKAKELLSKGDCFLMPTAPSFAPKFDESLDQLSENYLIADNHLCLANFGGFPSLTLPLALEDKLPLGVNVTSLPFEDEKVFSIGKKIEGITGLKGLCAGDNHE